MITIQFDNWATIISVLLRLAAVVVLMAFVIPLQIKEAGVKNGLAVLRKQLLFSGILLTFVTGIGTAFLLFRAILDDGWYRIFSNGLSILNSAAFLAVAWIFYQIYHQQYSPEQK